MDDVKIVTIDGKQRRRILVKSQTKMLLAGSRFGTKVRLWVLLFLCVQQR